MSEASIQQEIRLALGREPSVRLFRNNVGMLKDAKGHIVRFGLHPGSGDLIGPRTIIITPEMIGQPIAVFSSIEVKDIKGKPSPDQQLWADTIVSMGGYAGIARSVADARAILRLP